jgi:hypothetical protein
MDEDLGAASPSRVGGPPRTGSAPQDRLRRLSPPLWATAAVITLFLSACGIQQEIRFNADGSGTASIMVTIPKECTPPACPEEAKRLLGGEGPFAQAKANAESLPFDVRVVDPFESSSSETGYTLSFDFASVEDLEQKLAPDPTSGRSQTSAIEISGITFEANGDGGFTFTAESVEPTSPNLPAVLLDIVLPGGEGEHNAVFARGAQGGTRFGWQISEPPLVPGQQLQASTCSRGSCPGSSTLGSSTLIVGGWAVAIMVAVVFAFMLRRRQRDERDRRGPEHA